jgi:nucleoside-diphosphate-sugar epimerase
MAIVAVAGGTGDVGRTIVEALLETGKHTVFVLGRKVRDIHFIRIQVY